MTGFSSIALKSSPPLFRAKATPEFADYERPAVGNRNAATDACGAEVFSSLEHLEEHAFGFVVEPEKADELLEDLVLRVALELEPDGVPGKNSRSSIHIPHRFSCPQPVRR